MPPRRPLSNRPPQGNILFGMLRVARGKPDGLAQFGGTKQSFLTSLAPLVAFPLVGSLLRAGRGDPQSAVVEFLAALCALLVPPVLSYELARAWRRESQWLHFATAFNWCFWLVQFLLLALVFFVGITSALGLPLGVALGLGAACVVGYALWLHWFLARHALQISRMRAALLVVAINLGMAVLVLGPQLLVLKRG